MSNFGHLRNTNDSCEVYHDLLREPLSKPSWFVVTGGLNLRKFLSDEGILLQMGSSELNGETHAI